MTLVELAKAMGCSREQYLRDYPPLETHALACCGVVEVSSRDFLRYSKRDFLDWLRGIAIKSDEDDYDYSLRGVDNWRAGILLASTVGHQRDYISWLKEMGFERMKRFKNHNTGRFVTLWSFDLKKKKGDRQ